MYAVKINIKHDRTEQKLVSNVAPGQTLLEVLQEAEVDLPFTCGGVCSCSTCHIILQQGQHFLDEKSRREMDFIKRAKNPEANSRLACQCLLLEDCGEIEITIPN